MLGRALGLIGSLFATVLPWHQGSRWANHDGSSIRRWALSLEDALTLQAASQFEGIRSTEYRPLNHRRLPQLHLLHRPRPWRLKSELLQQLHFHFSSASA